MSIYLGNTPICGGIEGNQLNNPFSLLDYKFSEYEITNASWLRSNGQYNSGTTYADVYNLLLQIYNGTVAKAGVSVKLSTETYADTDFVLNTTDTTFRLPTKVALASGKAVAGNGMTLGLYGKIGTNEYDNGLLVEAGSGDIASIKWQNNNQVGQSYSGSSGYFTNGTTIGITSDPTKSGIETSANGLYLYFYVGETVQDANLINAGQVLNDVANLKAHYIVETYANGTSWYRIWSDGWIEQGGQFTNTNSTFSVNLLKTMSNTNYSVLVTLGENNKNSSYSINIGEKTTTSFTGAMSSSNTTYKSCWYACGY